MSQLKGLRKLYSFVLLLAISYIATWHYCSHASLSKAAQGISRDDLADTELSFNK